MEVAKSFGAAVFWGMCDSFRGVYTLFYLDEELERRKLSRVSPTHSNSPLRRKSESRDQTPVRTQKQDTPTVKSRVVHCGLLNGAIFLASILFFESIVMPTAYALIVLVCGTDSYTAQISWFWGELIARIMFQTLWVVPLFAVSKFVNNLWFQDIGNCAYKYSGVRHSSSLSLSKTVADFIFSSVVETLFLLQALLMTYVPIPYLGLALYLIHLSLLYSLYAFEYKWAEMGWEIHKRLTCIESIWPYFIGFGLPLALFTQISSYWMINGCIFSMLFPVYIISANQAHLPPEPCSRIQFFSPVIVVSNTIFGVLRKEKKPTVQRPVTQTRR